MGARGEKYARRLLARMEEVEARMDAVERQQMDSDRYISGLQELSGRYHTAGFADMSHATKAWVSKKGGST